MDNETATAIATRRSIRAFTAQPVPEARVREILSLASRAPSMTNTQPWRVHVLTGASRARLCAEILAAHEADAHGKMEYDYYPREWRSPYLDRRRQVGWALYGLLGIAKGDRAATKRQHARNFDFFGAPVGLIFTIDRDLGTGSYLDYGMFLENIMIAARGFGLDTCPQAAFATYPAIIRRQLGVPEHELVLCGMALGYADPEAVENRLVTERVSVEEFVSFH